MSDTSSQGAHGISPSPSVGHRSQSGTPRGKLKLEVSPSKRRYESPAQRPIVTEPDSDEEPPQKGSKQIPKPQSPQPSTQDEAASMQAILAKQYTDAKLEIAQAREAILADARKEVANIE